MTGNEFERITPAQAGLDPRCIINMMQRMEKEKIDITSFVLLRHGKILCEAYYEPYEKDQLRTVFSLSKTFTSMAIGIAAGEGKIDLDEKITDLFAEEIEKGQIPVGKELASLTIRHLLRMSTGQEHEPNRGDSDWNDMATAFLSTPFHEMPGEVFRYNSMATYMLSASLKKKEIDLEEYLEEKLLTPMGISGTRWLRDPRGICTAGFGFSLYPEVIAKLGQMILQGGVWNGKQLVPKTYIEMATSKQIENGDDPASDWAQGYGYQMWRCKNNAVRGDGMYGQFCMIHKETDTVLAMTAVTGDMQGEMNVYYEEVLLHYQDQPLAEDEEAMKALRECLAALHYTRPLPEDDGSKLPEKLKKLELPLADFFDLTLSCENDLITLTDKEGEIRYLAGRGEWKKTCRKVHCTPLYTKKNQVDTPVIGAWGMKAGSLVIKVYEIEMLEEDTLTLTPEEDGVQVKLVNTTIPSQPNEYISTEIQ